MTKDQQLRDDFEAIANMLEKAEAVGLLVEVVMKFGDERAWQQPVEKAAITALHEWDI